MKIKDLIQLHAFRDAEFINNTTHERICDEDTEISDIDRISICEQVEPMHTKSGTYSCLHRWLKVFVDVKEE